MSTQGFYLRVPLGKLNLSNSGESLNTPGKTLSKSNLIETTWEDLKDLKDTNKLSPGTFYRITDVTDAFDPDGKYAGKQVDVVVLALSENSLSEKAYAVKHEDDNMYTVTWSDNTVELAYIFVKDNLTYYVKVEDLQGFIINDVASNAGLDVGEVLTLNEANKTATFVFMHDWLEEEDWQSGLYYNDLSNENLEAWEINYCLENDKDRFSWAINDENETLELIVVHNNFSDTNNSFLRYPDGDIESATLTLEEAEITISNQTGTFTANGKESDPMSPVADSYYYRWTDVDNITHIYYTTSATPSIGDQIYIKNIVGFSANFSAVSGSTVESYTPAETITGRPEYSYAWYLENGDPSNVDHVLFTTTATPNQGDAVAQRIMIGLGQITEVPSEISTDGMYVYAYKPYSYEIVTGKGIIYNNLDSNVIKTTWFELKTLRDNNKLIPGKYYRITDYNCTVISRGYMSANHPFDIVLLALSENELAEEGWAMMNESNVYNVTFTDGVTKKCWIYQLNDEEVQVIDCETLLGVTEQPSDVIINGNTATVDDLSNQLTNPKLPYNYFQNSNLSAWKVWYCLDNDTDRFSWVDRSVDETVVSINDGYQRNSTNDYTYNGTLYYAWYLDNSAILFTLSESPQIGDSTYMKRKGGTMEQVSTVSSRGITGTGIPNGRGVIYRLIDEWNNDCPYDFKNIKIMITATDGTFDQLGSEEWVYTFTFYNGEEYLDASMKLYTSKGNYYTYATNNYIEPTSIFGLYFLPEVVFLGIDMLYSNKIYNSSQVIGLDCCSTIVYSSTNLELPDSQSIYINGSKVVTQ